jgi:2-succinyl-5-enolpyruvyl-6-hydroxy-3-cyclohexene-1-carboxylate synthase
VANLHPAVLEASHAGVALVVLTPTDRQRCAVPAQTRPPSRRACSGQPSGWRPTCLRRPEPPYAPSCVGRWPPLPVCAHTRRARCTSTSSSRTRWCPTRPMTRRSGPPVVPVAHRGRGSSRSRHRMSSRCCCDRARARSWLPGTQPGPPARRIAEQGNWPLLAEPSSGSRTGTHPIATYRLLLAAEHLGGAIERVVVTGHPTLSRPVNALLARPMCRWSRSARSPGGPTPVIGSPGRCARRGR